MGGNDMSPRQRNKTHGARTIITEINIKSDRHFLLKYAYNNNYSFNTSN